MTTHTQEQKVARYVQEVTGLLYTTCLAATRSARLRVEDGPDFTRRWQELAIRDAKTRGQWKKSVAEQHGEDVAGMAESSVLADEQRREWAKQNLLQEAAASNPEPYSREWREQWRKTVAEQRDAERQSRGVEGELKPLPKAHRQCGNRFCRKSAITGSAFCEDHGDESQPLKSTGRKP